MFNNTKVVANIIMKGDREKRVKEKEGQKFKGNQGGLLLDKKGKDEKEFVALSNGGRCKMILRRGNPRFCRPSPTGTWLLEPR